MIMKNLAIIPARSGSKGLQDKNIKHMCDKPLLAYTIEAAIKSNLFDQIMVSTDSERYAEVARSCGAQVPFLRSDQMATDSAGSWDVVREVLEMYEQRGQTFDTVALLQPTSPLRTAEDLINSYKMLSDINANFIVGVCEMDHSPLWSNELPEDNSMKDFIKSDVANLPRQAIPTFYRINGALYIIKVDHLKRKMQNLYDHNSYAYIMEKENSIDIDDALDFEIASIIMSKRTNLNK